MAESFATTTDMLALKQELVDGAALVASIGLVPLTQGNLSLRDPDSGRILMTPHDFSYEQMTTDDVLALDLAGNVIEGNREPSHESQVHLAVYERRADAMGIVHAEPIYTNLFGVLHKPIAPLHVGALIDVRGDVPVMPFAPSGSRQFGYDMLEVMGDRNAVVWANHGMLALGNSLQKAIHCTVMVEISAQLYHMALQHGEPHQIPQQYYDRLVG
ncbi:MAG: class II aldolase/adducin family protein [Chloroflexota bacterium]|nr:class II aldolase/adducin family protein [Chloroflexota bacterium]